MGRIVQSARRDSAVFFFDVDNTLLDNDRVTADLREHLKTEVGAKRASRYWAIFENLRARLGYADYLGALQQYRGEHPHDLRIMTISRFLVNYPFADRLYPGALDTIRSVKKWGTTGLLSDGDVVFQPRKVDCSGLFKAVNGHVLIYVHKEKELRDVERRFPARHYVMVDDKLRILTAIKKIWRSRVTTVFVRQGHYALDAEVIKKYPPADITIEHIRDLRTHKREELTQPRRALAPSASRGA